MKDYLAMRKVEGDDKLDHGVKGMKWGRRRTPAQLALARGSSDASSTKKTDVPETSSARYNRLKAQAKEKGANSLDDEDLKFFNARTEAMAKINKMNQQDPGWLSETTKKIIQKTTQETLQNVASAVAQQYVTKPVVKSLGAEAAPKPKKKK